MGPGADPRKAFQQLRFMAFELGLIVNHKWWRWLTIWFGTSAGVIISYRLDRFFFLLIGNAWALGRVFFFPLFLVLRIFSARHGLNFRAAIGKGLLIFNPTAGVIVSGKAIVGEHFTMCGGNTIGSRKDTEFGDIVLGNHVFMGVNSVILGPIVVGDHVTVGAGAVVIDSVPGPAAVAGVPAKRVSSGPAAGIGANESA